MSQRGKGNVLQAQPGSTASTTHPKQQSHGSQPADSPTANARPGRSHGAIREIVESLVIAFVLAFLFRTFEAEPFVIPTGSMATTLLGRNKDVVCQKCGFPYQISASEEVNPETNQPTGRHVVAGTCPNCRYTMYLGADRAQANQDCSSYKGDRILVGKFAYDFAEPQRWDVAVFRWPGGADTNYIKRLVGLPKETLKISHGDIFVRRDGEHAFHIARKPPAKLEALLQPVYDNDYVPSDLIKRGWPARWAPVPSQSQSAGCWQTSDDFRSFHTDGSAKDMVWLGYRHFVPSYQDWDGLNRAGTFGSESSRPQLISDFSGYNTNVNADAGYLEPPVKSFGLHWVGDLAIEATLEVQRPSGEAVFELVKGGERFRCHVDLAKGVARLLIDGLEAYRATAQTDVRGPGEYRIRFANVDQQLLLWVNGRVVAFDKETAYPPLKDAVPTEDDLEPVRIGSQGAALKICHLKLSRDLYYIAFRPGRYEMMGEAMTDFPASHQPYEPLTPQGVAHFLSTPRQWKVFSTLREVEFKLDKDQYLMLGDNSAESSDSRLWEPRGFEPYVSRDLLIGKALYIYWPHPWNYIPGTHIWFPMVPNFARMGLVR
jgi:signal peptidase I